KFYGAPLGLARAAIDRAVETFATKYDAGAQQAYRNAPRIQTAVAEAEMILGAARSYAYGTLEKYWRALDAGRPTPPRMRLEPAPARVNAASAARTVIRMLYDAVGGAAIFSTRGPFDRMLRDIETMNQHLAVQRRVLENVGAILLNSETRPSVPYI